MCHGRQGRSSSTTHLSIVLVVSVTKAQVNVLASVPDTGHHEDFFTSRRQNVAGASCSYYPYWGRVLSVDIAFSHTDFNVRPFDREAMPKSTSGIAPVLGQYGGVTHKVAHVLGLSGCEFAARLPMRLCTLLVRRRCSSTTVSCWPPVAMVTVVTACSTKEL